MTTGFIPEKSLEKFHQSYDLVDMGYESRCWIWKKALKWHDDEKNKTRFNGYGQFWFKEFGCGESKNHRVHRAAYTHYRGEIAPGMTLDHRCNVEACCNPWHVEQETDAENNRLKWERLYSASAIMRYPCSASK